MAQKIVLPSDLQVLTLLNTDYFIECSRLHPGASFFLPTLATARQARNVIDVYAEELGMVLAVRTRCEYGRYGVRVWRLD